MTSTSSKALPYIGLALGLLMTGGVLLGYGDQIDKAIALLQAMTPFLGSTFAVSVGGLINKALEVRRDLGNATSLEQIRDIIKEELAK